MVPWQGHGNRWCLCWVRSVRGGRLRHLSDQNSEVIMPIDSFRIPGAALRTSAVVGTLLTLANQGPTLVTGEPTAAVLLQTAVNYLIPLGVSLHSRGALLRELAREALERGVAVEVAEG